MVGFERTATRDTSRDDLPEERQPFRTQLRGNLAEARDVATRPSETRDESCRHRITDAEHDDGDYPGHLLGRLHHRLAHSDDDVHVQADQFTDDLRVSSGAPLHGAMLKDEVLSLHVAPLAHLPAEDVEVGIGTALGNRGWAKVSDPVNLPRRLRLGDERRGQEREGDAGDEGSSVHHSIT